MSHVLKIKTLGVFSVSLGDSAISDSSIRSQKLWKTFKYLLTNRHKMVSPEMLIDVLWADQMPDNPGKSLQTLVSRLRKKIDIDTDGDSHFLYLHGAYQWNPRLPIELDVAGFEQKITQAEEAEDDNEKIGFLQQAVEMYQGDYLSESTSDAWVLPVRNHYKRLYVRTVLDLADAHMQNAAYNEVVRLCMKAVEHEQYEESIYEYLIQALIINDEIAEAQKQYQYYSELVQRAFGAKPSEEFLSLSQGMWDAEGLESDLFDIKKRLDVETMRRGAFFCTSDTFNQIYQLDRRSSERLQFPVFLALITLAPKKTDLPEGRSLRGSVLALRQCLMRTLRRGDIVSQYSKNQFLLLLSAYIQKDAETALDRVDRMFADSPEAAGLELRTSLSQIGS